MVQSPLWKNIPDKIIALQLLIKAQLTLLERFTETSDPEIISEYTVNYVKQVVQLSDILGAKQQRQLLPKDLNAEGNETSCSHSNSLHGKGKK